MVNATRLDKAQYSGKFRNATWTVIKLCPPQVMPLQSASDRGSSMGLPSHIKVCSQTKASYGHMPSHAMVRAQFKDLGCCVMAGGRRRCLQHERGQSCTCLSMGTSKRSCTTAFVYCTVWPYLAAIVSSLPSGSSKCNCGTFHDRYINEI